MIDATQRQLIEYLPPVLREIEEMQAIMIADQEEIDALWAKTKELLDNQFVPTANGDGIARFERMFKIIPRATDTLEERRFRIFIRFAESMPYTIRALDAALKNLCGNENYKIELQPNTYEIAVRVALAVQSSMSDVAELLDDMLPANLLLALTWLFNRHDTLAGHTHGVLNAYTHHRLRYDKLRFNRHFDLKKHTHEQLSAYAFGDLRKEDLE